MATSPPVIHLASRSPRRRELLTHIGVPFETVSVDVDETHDGAESAEDYTTRLACEKALAGVRALASVSEPVRVLGADTTVVLDETIFGKPRDRADAGRMLRRLSGRWHRVLTAVALAVGERVHSRLQVSEVRMAVLDDHAIDAYWATGEPRDKAGSYAIQGLAAPFIAELRGSYTGVMGLPLHETFQLLNQAAVPGFESLAAYLSIHHGPVPVDADVAIRGVAR